MKYLTLILAIIAMCACSSKKQTEPNLLQPTVLNEKPLAGVLPKARIYKMSGQYADNVPVQMGQDGTIISYPAPGDVVGQEPIAVAHGWWLDRRGIGTNSAFTRWTYAEYSQLPEAPTQEEIRAAIIPGARVTELKQLPMTMSEAIGDTAAVNAWIRTNL